MSRFKRVAFSNPKFERDHLTYISLRSPALNGRGDITVFVPPNCEKINDLPVCLLLHGVGTSHFAWTKNAGAHLTALDLINSDLIKPMLLVMPSDGLWGDGSGYINHEKNFEAWIIEDVIDIIKERFVNVTENSSFFISGFSMGGYGALRLGSKYGEIFTAIGGHASITKFEQMKFYVAEELTAYQIDRDEPFDIFDNFMLYRNQLPPVRFDVPLSDNNLLEPNRELHRKLLQENFTHEYAEHKGIHEWDFCERHIADTLQFFNSFLH